MAQYQVVLEPSLLKLEMLTSAPKEILLYVSPAGGTNLIDNGGGPGKTDWTNPSGGLAQYWGQLSLP